MNRTNKHTLKLTGKAKEDFHKWYYLKYNNYADDIDCWPLSVQMEYYSKFFNVNILDSNAFNSELEKYNAKESNL